MLDLAAYGARAGALEREGRLPEAEAVLRDALSKAPGHPAASYALAIVLFRQGRHSEAWPLYEARHLLSGSRPKPQLGFPEWQGQSVHSLLLLPEQGLGDQIMFARYVPALKSLGIDVTLVCSRSLVRWLTPLDVALIPVDGTITLPRRDAWSLIGSLPRHLGIIPPASALQVEKGGEGVGIISSGALLPDPGRSLDRASAASLLAMPGAIDLLPETTGATDFQDTANLISELAAVVSVDTSGAHLAASMGKPTLLMVPSLADWRWGLLDRTPWYPTMQILRQNSAGDWKPVVAQAQTNMSAIAR